MTLMDKIKAANKAAGFYWFDPKTLAFFRTRVLSTVYPGNYFVTSEKYYEFPRRYSVHQSLSNGDVCTVGCFQAYPTREAAIAAAKRLGKEASK